MKNKYILGGIAILGLIVALLVPIGCYLALKYFSDTAVDMPRKYLLDTVVTKIEKGKEINDSIWHTTANIRLQNQFCCQNLWCNLPIAEGDED